jgi:hypothetical protein
MNVITERYAARIVATACGVPWASVQANWRIARNTVQFTIAERPVAEMPVAWLERRDLNAFATDLRAVCRQ